MNKKGLSLKLEDIGEVLRRRQRLWRYSSLHCSVIEANLFRQEPLNKIIRHEPYMIFFNCNLMFYSIKIFTLSLKMHREVFILDPKILDCLKNKKGG
jgi:hypothetical protein